MQDGHRVLVADYEDVEGEVAVELLRERHDQVGDGVLVEVEALKSLGTVLEEDAAALCLDRGGGTYLSWRTMALMLEFQTSRWMMLSWVRLTSFGHPSNFLALSAEICMRSCTSRFLLSFSKVMRWLFLGSRSTVMEEESNYSALISWIFLISCLKERYSS